MSAEAVGWVYRHSPFTGATFAVHLALADACNDLHENEVWSPQATIAAKARVSSRTTAQAAFTSLRDAGYLTLLEDNSRKEGGAVPNRYRLEFPVVPVVYGTPRPVTSAWTPGVTSDWSGGVQRLDTEPNDEREELSPLPPTASAPAATPPPPTDLTERAFDRIWTTYPRKVERKAALRAFRATVRRVGPSAVSDLAKATANYAEACRGKDPKYVKHGSTFYGPDEPWRDYLNGVPVGTDGRAPVLTVGMPGFLPESLR